MFPFMQNYVGLSLFKSVKYMQRDSHQHLCWVLLLLKAFSKTRTWVQGVDLGSDVWKQKSGD